MYPNQNSRPAKPEHSLIEDLEYLTSVVHDAKSKPYLKGALVDSLANLGHDRSAASDAIDQYFKVTLQ